MIGEWLKSGSVMSTTDDRILIGWGNLHKVSSEFEVRKQGGFYFPDFFLTDPLPWFVFEHVEELQKEELLKLVGKENFARPSSLTWKNPYYSHFCKMFEALMAQIASREIEKGVPFVFETASQIMSQEQLFHSLTHALKVLQNYPGYLYGFWHHQTGMLGVTPELLFSYQNTRGCRQLQTMACAGTSRKDKEQGEFAANIKELHEHELVVQGIKESLAHFGKVHIGKRTVLSLPAMNHLVTPISVDLRAAPCFDRTVSALHPTPALGAFPKIAGKRWLESYQKKIDRQRFGAPAGFIKKDGQAACYVAIRNVQWDENQMLIGAGCGVVAASQCDQEWAEISLKLQAVKKMLVL